MHPATNPTAHRVRSSALATLAFCIALTAGLLGTACSSSSGPEAITTPSSSDSAAEVTSTVAAPAPSVTAATDATTSHRAAVVVRSDHDLVVHDDPDTASPSRTLSATNEFGSALALLVTRQDHAGWVEVLLPGRPTGATAWLALDGSDVELREVTTEIEVDLAARTLTLYDRGEVVLTTPVAIGSPDAPTPTGRFSVTDKLQDPDPTGAYGPFALGLSGRSDVLTDFAGGDGQIGIHGTNDPASIGSDVSHGCIRVPNDVIVQLNEVLPLGTPVVVR